MVPRKKRSRYYWSAREIGARIGVDVKPGDWETIWTILEQNEEPTYVYAIVDKKANLVKFGRSVNPGVRLKALQTSNGRKLDIWGFCREVEGLCEASLHSECHMHRVQGEWFTLNERTRYWIDRIREQAGVTHQPC